MERLAVGLVACLLTIAPGCTKQQVLPITIAGAGGGLMTGGFIYSATREEGSGFFGSSTGEAAAIGAMVFGGIALAATGVLFAITSADCETDADCWSGDACLADSGTCVSREPTVVPPATEPEPEGGSAVADLEPATQP